MPLCVFMGLCFLQLYLQEFFETWVEIAFFQPRFALLLPVDYTNILGILELKFSSFTFSDTGDIYSYKKPPEGLDVIIDFL